MNKEDDYLEFVEEPLIELLAIKLFEHDAVSYKTPKTLNIGWMTMANDDRELFRNLARGRTPIGYVPEDE